MNTEKVIAGFLRVASEDLRGYPTTVGRIKPAPTYEELKGFADKVEIALKEVVKRFDVNIDSTDPAGNADPIR